MDMCNSTGMVNSMVSISNRVSRTNSGCRHNRDNRNQGLRSRVVRRSMRNITSSSNIRLVTVEEITIITLGVGLGRGSMVVALRIN